MPNTIINQGDLYWAAIAGEDGETGIPHPHVILQDNVFNHSRLTTVVACALTTNLARVSVPGNLLLEPGEGGLPKQSVVEASKLATLEKAQLGDYIGTLSEARIGQILTGLRFVQAAFLARR